MVLLFKDDVIEYMFSKRTLSSTVLNKVDNLLLLTLVLKYYFWKYHSQARVIKIFRNTETICLINMNICWYPHNLNNSLLFEFYQQQVQTILAIVLGHIFPTWVIHRVTETLEKLYEDCLRISSCLHATFDALLWLECIQVI